MNLKEFIISGQFSFFLNKLKSPEEVRIIYPVPKTIFPRVNDLQGMGCDKTENSIYFYTSHLVF